jgi:putative protease
MAEIEIGHVGDFFARPVVAGIDLLGPLRVGDTVHILGHTTDLTFVVRSLQINRVEVAEAKAGDSVGVKAPERVRHGDRVYKVLPD